MWYSMGLFLGETMSNPIAPFVVRITDEFGCVFSLEADSKTQVITTITKWLNHKDETPITEIVIEIND